MKRFFHIVMFILLTGFEGCDDIINPRTELEKLPPATQEGKSTFGCLVNGKAWVTRSSTDALADYQSGVLQISAGIDETNRDQGITLVILSGLSQGMTYDLTNDPQYEAKFSWTQASKVCFYDDEDTLSGHLKITKLDQVNLIISGLFEFTTAVSGCDTINVTDGRFDLLYAN